jgi:chromosome segregation ATPase
MSVNKLRSLIHEWETELNENFKEEFYEAIESVEEQIADLEDELDESGIEVSTLKRKVDRLEDDIEDLQGNLEDAKESSEKYYNSLDDELKQEWWEAVKEKYTLAQLEAILGNRFNLKDI